MPLQGVGGVWVPFTQGAALGYVLLPLRGVLFMSFDTPSTQPPFLCYRIFSHKNSRNSQKFLLRIFSHKNSRNSQKFLLRIFSHRIHGSTQIVRLRRPPTEFRSQKLGCAPIRSGGILPPQQPITLIFRGCSICENLCNLWEPPLSKKVL